MNISQQEKQGIIIFIVIIKTQEIIYHQMLLYSSIHERLIDEIALSKMILLK